MNAGKRGRPFEFTESMVGFMMDFRTMGDSTFRFVSGLVGGIYGWFGIAAPSYARLNERANVAAAERYGRPEENEERYGKGVYAIIVPENDTARRRAVGLDGTGLALGSQNGWRREKWGTGPARKGWDHAHLASDLDSMELLALAVTDRSVGDATMLRPVVDAVLSAGVRIGTFYGDGAYGNSDDAWKYLTMEKGIDFVTSFKRNTAPRNNGCPARGEAARQWCSMPFWKYSKVTGYGKRWKSEAEMSDFKEVFPETVTSRTKLGEVAQIASRANMFNRFKRIRAKIMGVTGNGVVIGRSRPERRSEAPGHAR